MHRVANYVICKTESSDWTIASLRRTASAGKAKSEAEDASRTYTHLARCGNTSSQSADWKEMIGLMRTSPLFRQVRRYNYFEGHSIAGVLIKEKIV